MIEAKENVTSTPEEETTVKGTTMNVYTALSKRKILQKQLDEVLSSPSKVCVAALITAEKINGKTREDAINEMKAAYDKPRALIKNIRILNSAIAISNATTRVTVGDITYTVEELIYRMLHIDDELKFYNGIVRNINDAKVAVETNRVKNLSESVIAEHVNKLLPTMVAPDASTEERDKQATTIREAYIKNMTMDIVDPCGMIEKIEGIIQELKVFKDEVNNALNLSNIQTTITVDLEG